MAAVIQKNDLAEDDALKVPIDLNDSFTILLGTINQLGAAMKDFQSSFGKDNSIPKAKSDTEDLTQAQIELIKIQNQIAIQVARNNDAYREQQAVLQNVKNEMKNAQAVSDLTRNFTAQYASLQELEKALNANRVAYASLRGEEERTSAAGQQILKNIQDQNKAVTDLRNSMGQHLQTQEKFGDLLEKAIPAFKGINKGAVEAGEAVMAFGKQLLSLLANPIILGIAAVVASLALIKKGMDLYTESTVDGADKANLFSKKWGTAIELVNSQLKKLGKTVIDFVAGDDNKLPNWLEGLINMLPDGVAFLAAYNVRLQQNIEIGKLENDLKKEEIKLTVELAENQLKADEALFQARDKVHNTNQERYDDLLKANQLIKDGEKLRLDAADNERKLIVDEIQKKDKSIQDDITTLELLKDKNTQTKIGYDLIQQLADVEVKRLNIENDALQGSRRRQALEATLIQEEEKRQLTATQIITDAKIKLEEDYYVKIKNIQDRIVGNNQYSLERQLDAQKVQTQALINLDNQGMAKELETAKKSAIDRVQLNSTELKAIFGDSKLSYDQKVALAIQTKEEEIKNDKGYNKEIEAIEQAHADTQKNIILKSVNDRSKVYTDYYKALATKAEQGLTDEQKILEEAYANGTISVQKYTAVKLLLEQNYKIAKDKILVGELQDEVAYYESLETLTKDQEKALATLKVQLADKEFAALKDKNAHKLEIDKQAYQLEVGLVNTTARAITTIGDNLMQARIDQENRVIQNLQTSEQTALTEAGNNADAKNQITKKYTILQQQAQSELANSQREKAIFDKALSATNVLIKTAEAVAAQLPGLPYTAPLIALIEATGAVEEAAIIASPIPHFKDGTKSAPGGWSVIDDGGGNEIVKEPSGKAYMYDMPGAKLTYLKEGSQVFTKSETQKILNGSVSSTFSSGQKIYIEHNSDFAPLGKKIDELTKTIKTKKEFHINVTKDGVDFLIRQSDNWNRMVGNRYK